MHRSRSFTSIRRPNSSTQPRKRYSSIGGCTRFELPAKRRRESADAHLRRTHPRTDWRDFFNISDNGKIPDVYQGGEDNSACSQPLWTVNFTGEADNSWLPYDQGLRTPTCPGFDQENPHPPPDPCAVKANEELALNGSIEMLAAARCIRVPSWPNSSLVGLCRDEG